MFAKRRHRIQQKEQEAAEESPIDDVELSDSEIDEIFEVRKKGAKSSKSRKRTKENGNKREKAKPTTSQPADRRNDQQQDENTSDDLVLLDSDDDEIIPARCPAATRSQPADDRLPSNHDSDSDDILICSTHNSPARESASFANSTFDESQFDASKFNYARQTNIKFRYQGSYKCVQFYSTDKFKEKLDELREVLGIDPSKMVLMFDGKTISFEDSPESLNITIVDIIDVFDKKEENQLLEEEEDPNLFKIKFRDCDSRKKNQDVALTMNRYDTFQGVFRKYAEKKELNLNEIIFEFDGERMSANDKPDDLDMESDSVVEVKMKRA